MALQTWLGGTMNAIRKAGGLVLGAALMAGCSERNVSTGPTGTPTGVFSADVAAGKTSVVIEHRVYRSGFTDPLDPKSSAGILVDRRPLLTGGQAIVTPIQFSMEGTKLTWVVDAALLGDPATFQWADATLGASAGDDVKNGYNNISILDQAPNVNQGAPRATWPQ